MPHCHAHTRFVLGRRASVVAVFLVGLGIGPIAARGQTPAVTEDSVDRAVQRGVEWLKSQRHADGHWEPREPGSKFYGGDTGLVLLALLYAGESPQSEFMTKSLRWLADVEMKETYTIATRAHVFALAGGREYRSTLVRDFDWLTENLLPEPSPNAGAYDYEKPVAEANNRYDNSNSQYGVLGVWMATDAGLTARANYWELVAGHWLRDQNGDGGWPYQEGASKGSMTAAGLATLFVAFDRLYVDRARDAEPLLRSIERGLGWIGDHFAVDTHPGGEPQWKYYYLYSVERVGRASGQKYFRGVDWFRDIAAHILAEQDEEGAWPNTGDSAEFEMTKQRNTAFAIMFLCHGRAPVLFNKLEHLNEQETRLPEEPERPGRRRGEPAEDPNEPEMSDEERLQLLQRMANWNTYPRDVAGLTRYAQGSLERLLNWQIVKLDGTLEDLMEAPVLYLTGRDEMDFEESDVLKLREYCLRGGLLLGVAADDSDAFATSFRELAGRMFPAYRMEPVAADHPLLSGEVRSPIADGPRLEQVHNGLRMLMLLCEEDVAESWHRYSTRAREEHFQLGVNLYLYATDKAPAASRLKTPFMPLRDVPTQREIRVARLKYEGRWDPEPYGWERLRTYMNNETGTRLIVEPVKIDAGDLRDYPVAHITGTAAVELSEDQRKALRRYLTRGGTLIMDATGGSPEFTESLERQLSDILRERGERMPDTSPIITGTGIPDARPLRNIGYRRAARRESLGSDTPRLMAFTIRRQAAVIYSPLDLSTGLLGTQVYDCRGYDGESSLRIMRNLLLYAQMSAADKAELGAQ